ncbi:hypothetical protein Srufu_032780 [Streptomyces libani subsp. rufus]|nr:hypothetical protein Srufu_032780 [Streptomyces libani subsp. rufus]
MIKVLVHSHQNCGGRPETLSTAARRKPDRLVGPGVDADMTFPPSNGEAVRGGAAGGWAAAGAGSAGADTEETTDVSGERGIRTLLIARLNPPLN